MAWSKLRTTKDGRHYYEIRAHVSENKTLQTRWYVPDGWSQRAIDREVAKQTVDFQLRCEAGEVMSRADKKELAEAKKKAAQAIETVKQYGERVFMPYKEITLTENTRAYYQNALNNHIYPAIGDIKLPELTSAQISAFFLSLQRSDLAFSTIKGIYMTLGQLLKKAYMDDTIDRNPMDKVEKPKQKKDTIKKDRVESYTIEELNNIISCLDSQSTAAEIEKKKAEKRKNKTPRDIDNPNELIYNEPLKWRAFLHLLIDSGVRRGEACGLQWQNIDFEKRRITISQTMNYTTSKGVYYGNTKTGQTRTFGISAEVANLLATLRAEQLKNGILSEYVFLQDGSGAPMHPQSPTRYMEKFSRKYGIEHFHPHKLRHTFASIAITQGADIASVSEKLGHADKSTTLRLYTHADEESIEKASNIFREALKAQK